MPDGWGVVGIVLSIVVLRRGSDLELDRWGVSLPKCELCQYQLKNRCLKKRERPVLQVGSRVKGRPIFSKER